jgi:two-component system, LytTR family, sensor histidine kinase AgrC
MAWYWWVLELSANLVEAIMLVVFIQQFSEPRFRNRIPYLASVAVVFAIITFMSSFYELPFVFTLLVYISIGVALGFLVFRGTVLSRLLLPVLLSVLVMVVDLLSMGILVLSFHADISSFFSETSARMLATIVSKVLLIILVFSMGRFSSKVANQIPLGYSLCLLLVPVISVIFMIAVGQNVVYDTDRIQSSIWFALSAVGIMFLNLLIIYLFQAMMKYSSNQSKLQLMLQQTEMLNRHLRETNALQEQTQRIWHDMKNHFTVIQWMVKSKGYDKLEQYMTTLNDAVNSSMPRFRSGNTIVDALLNAKSAEAESAGIQWDVNAAVPARLPIDDLDLNVVLSNALDNAIEACHKLPEEQARFISVDISIKNDHLVLAVKNPFTGEIKKSGHALQTTKKADGRHGIGIGNMVRAVEKYDGHILSDYGDNLFVLTAMMHCEI